MNMFSDFHFLSLFFIILLLMSSNGIPPSNANYYDAIKEHRYEEFSLGAIVDYNSRAGKEEKVAIKMAMEDYFGHILSYRPTLHVMNSRGDPVQAASSAKTLVKRHLARVIVGLGTWQEAASVAEFANKTEVPILSLANDIPPWAGSHWPFLVGAARSQFAQMKAVAAIIRSWEWRKVNIIYEDTNSASTADSIPYLIDVLREVKSEINELVPLSPLPQYNSLPEKLKNLKNGPCRVFIIHTSVTLETNIFKEAKKLGMIDKDFVWITTNSITDAIHTLTGSIMTSMQGVFGVESYFSHTGKQFKDFRSRFGAKFRREYPKETYSEPGIFALQAYDAIRAIALALKGYADWKNPTSIVDDADHMGQKLLKKILKSDFQGLTGAFNFKQRMLTPAHVYRIVNVVGRSNRIRLGFWTEGLGFSESKGLESTYKESMRMLQEVPWTVRRVLEEAKSTVELPHLLIGVPGGNLHAEFINVTQDPDGKLNVTGFCINVFNDVVGRLSYKISYDFVFYEGSYNSLVEQLSLKKYDAVVGDTAIISNRSRYAEFSQPYAEPGLQMVVYVKPRRTEGAWLFKKPFTSWMWAATGAIVLYNSFVVWLIERRHNRKFSQGTKLNQVGSVLSLAFMTLFSLHGEKLHSNLSRMTTVVWLFVALIITQSYTASLTSLLTHQRLDPIIPDVDTLRRNGDRVGCDGNSFVVQYLQEVLHFEHKNIVPIFTEDEYLQYLISGEMAAAFLEVPYVKVFLAKYCKNFTTGPTYSVGGFGFAFPRNSLHLPDISQAVLQLSEEGRLRKLQESMLSPYNCSAAEKEDDLDSLGLASFQGLFFITVTTSTIALFCFICCQVQHERNWFCWPYVILPQSLNSNLEDEINWLSKKPLADENSTHQQQLLHCYLT